MKFTPKRAIRLESEKNGLNCFYKNGGLIAENNFASKLLLKEYFKNPNPGIEFEEI